MAGIPSTPGSAGGASGSVPFGDATGLREELRSATAGVQGPTGQPAAQGGGGPQAAPPQPPPGAGQPDAQPPAQADPQADGQQRPPDVHPHFSAMRHEHDTTPWRKVLSVWAQHPKANWAVRHLAEVANRDRGGQ